MKISLNWLRNYLQLSESSEEIAHLLTQSGLEVAGVTYFESVKGGLAGLIVGQVLASERHPDADSLQVTRVAVGTTTPLTIVCGAPNVAVGQKVIVAPVGARLYPLHGEPIKIKKAKIRGIASEGMLCAEDEIGLGTTHEGIMVLDSSLSPGTPVAEYFSIQVDQVLEIDLTPNRGDACSHIGVARELSALLDRPVQRPAVDSFEVKNTHLPIRITVLDHDACPRYAGVVLSGVRVQASPQWLKDRLRAIGIQPTNNVVDATNFVLHELGQPLHAFDYDQIVAQQLTVKQLPAGTKIVTLDDQTRKLSGEELMICDEAGALCLAGVLGGKRGSIRAETTNVFLESAYFASGMIRKAAKHHGLKTDASFRYERGTDPNMTVDALKRACLLIQETAGGVVASELIDLYPEKIVPRKIEVTYANVTRLVGQAIPPATVRAILRRLDVSVGQATHEGFVAEVPPYRTGVRREVDLIQEIIRIYGYDRVEVKETLGSAHLAMPTQPAMYKWQYSISTLLADNGYHEICTNSLTKSSHNQLLGSHDGQQAVKILNPLSEALDTLRRTLLCSGLEVMAHNINRRQTDLKFFEFGKTYQQDGQQYTENNRLGLWLTGDNEGPTWLRKPRSVAFQDVNAVVHKILNKLGITAVALTPIANDVYKEGVQITQGKQLLLTAGQVHPTLLSSWSIKQPVFFADLDWDQLLQAIPPARLYESISKFPPVRRDLSLVLDQGITFEEIKTTIAQQNEKLIRDIAVFDVYEGANLPPDKKAYALSFTLQGKDKTLDEKTIDKVMKRLTKSFESVLGAIIRE